jgi:hypothetical protein
MTISITKQWAAGILRNYSENFKFIIGLHDNIKQFPSSYNSSRGFTESDSKSWVTLFCHPHLFVQKDSGIALTVILAMPYLSQSA